MSRSITVKVVPEIISGNWEKGIVVLSHNQAILSLLIVWLPICPIEPIDSFILVVPDPFSRVSFAVTFCGSGSKPKLFILTNIGDVKKLGFQPVVNSWMIKFCNPRAIMICAQKRQHHLWSPFLTH